jgi:2-polyprenyl-3-methyl-5-hydroxy-6-metoxy-1,4-benzoquinol methylase
MITLDIFKNTKLYTALPDKKYDVIIIPEVIEHINNVQDFLLQFNNILNENGIIYISGPNAFCQNNLEQTTRNKNNVNKFFELVHPDHNCWYSPYTLQNTIKKCYGNKCDIIKTGMIEDNTQVYVLYTLKPF